MSLIFSKRDIYINFENWSEGTPLFIMGASGDGKSTLARKIANERNAIIAPTDVVQTRINNSSLDAEMAWNHTGSSHEIDKNTVTVSFHDFMEENNWPYELDDKDPLCNKYYKAYFDYLMNNQICKNKLIVIEGCAISSLGADFFIKSGMPIIVMGGSRLRGCFRRAKRKMEKGKGKNFIKEIFTQFKKYGKIHHYLDNNKFKMYDELEPYA